MAWFRLARGAALVGLVGGLTARRRLWRRLDAPQRPAGDARHAARRPHRQPTATKRRADAGARRAGRPRRALRGGDHDDAADAVGAHQPVHRHLADGARRARQHRLLRRRARADAGRDVEGTGLPHRRIRRRVRARRALGHRPGLRHLLRRIRPVRGRRPRPGRHPAARRRGRRPGTGVARGSRRRAAVLRLGAPLRSRTRPYDAPAEFASRFPATRDGAYDAEIAYTDAQVGRLLAALDAAGRRDDTLVVVLADHGEQLGEHREQSHGFFVYDASVQIPLVMAGPGHRAAGGARPGAHRRRHADGARSAGRRGPGRRPGRVAAAGPRRPAAGAAGVFGDLVSALPLRLERAAGGARRRLQVHPGADPRALRRGQGPRRADQPGRDRPGARRPDGAGAAGPGGADLAGRRRQGTAGRRSGRRAAAARARLRRLDLGDASRGPPAPRPEGHHRALQPAAAGRHRLRGRAATTRPRPRC